MMLPQECRYCGADLSDPDVPESEPIKALWSLAVEVEFGKERVLACPFCRKVLLTL